jgi:hypothetical protein
MGRLRLRHGLARESGAGSGERILPWIRPVARAASVREITLVFVAREGLVRLACSLRASPAVIKARIDADGQDAAGGLPTRVAAARAKRFGR